MLLVPALLVGKCHACGTAYRWEGGTLRVKDAACLRCGGPLKRTKGLLGTNVQDVEADWLRKQEAT